MQNPSNSIIHTTKHPTKKHTTQHVQPIQYLHMVTQPLVTLHQTARIKLLTNPQKIIVNNQTPYASITVLPQTTCHP
eukprot:gene3453-2404_t